MRPGGAERWGPSARSQPARQPLTIRACQLWNHVRSPPRLLADNVDRRARGHVPQADQVRIV